MADKKRTDVDWQDLRFFLALAREGSLSAAARSLRVNHATVSRRVSCLESALGRPLFDRRAGGYALTADGRAVRREAETMEEAALAVLRRQDGGEELRGLVRMTTTRSLADAFLIDRLAGFRRLHPAVDIDVVADLRVMSLARREADMALRLGRPKDSELIARRLAVLEYRFYGAPDYGRRMEALAGEAELIGYGDQGGYIAEAEWLDRHFPHNHYAFRSNSQLAQAAAARAGFGLALLPCYLAGRDPSLAVYTQRPLLPPRELWLLIRPDLAKVPRVRALADFLIALFDQERALFAVQA